MVRDRLADSPFAAEPKAVSFSLAAPASSRERWNLPRESSTGRCESAAPLGFSRLPNGPRAHPLRACRPSGLSAIRSSRTRRTAVPRQLRTGTDGYFGKVGRWLREGF